MVLMPHILGLITVAYTWWWLTDTAGGEYSLWELLIWAIGFELFAIPLQFAWYGLIRARRGRKG